MFPVSCSLLHPCNQFLRLGVTPQNLDHVVEPLFWSAWRHNNYVLPSGKDKDNCYTFIFHPDEEHIELLHVRSLINLSEMEPEVFTGSYNWNIISDISDHILGTTKLEEY
jgi:hypothetical protein